MLALRQGAVGLRRENVNVKLCFSSGSKLVDHFTVCFEKYIVMGSMGVGGGEVDS